MDIRDMAAVHLVSMAAALIISHQHLHHTLRLPYLLYLYNTMITIPRVVTALYQSMAAVLTT